MKTNFRAGFTLIELLVVIAIIGILSQVVLASVNSARAKAVDAKIKATLANSRAQAENYHDSNGNVYSGVCTDGTGVLNMKTGAAEQSASVTCNDSADAWAMSAQLKSDITQYWCVDSTGTSTQKEAVLDTATNC